MGVQGADFVFHMASPFLASWEDTQKDLVEPALNGTSTVLESVAKTGGTVKRVVLTSSFAGKRCAQTLLKGLQAAGNAA